MKTNELMNAAMSDFVTAVENQLVTEELDINQKVNTLCYTIEIVSACMAQIARDNAPDEDHEVNRLTLDYMLEAVLERRCREFGTTPTGEVH